MTEQPTDNSWSTFVEILAEMPDVIDRLLDQHRPNGGNTCRACTAGGTGQQRTPWPCSISKLATRAGEIHRARSR